MGERGRETFLGSIGEIQFQLKAALLVKMSARMEPLSALLRDTLTQLGMEREPGTFFFPD